MTDVMKELAREQHIRDVRAHCGRIGGLSKSERKRSASSANMRKAQAIRAERQRKARLDADGGGQPVSERV